MRLDETSQDKNKNRKINKKIVQICHTLKQTLSKVKTKMVSSTK